MEIRLIRSVKVSEDKGFDMEYYLGEQDESDINIGNYEVILIKRINDRIVDMAYNKLPYVTQEAAIKFINKLSENIVTPTSFNYLLEDDICTNAI